MSLLQLLIIMVDKELISRILQQAFATDVEIIEIEDYSKGCDNNVYGILLKVLL
jgi:hypothetical protein